MESTRFLLRLSLLTLLYGLPAASAGHAAIPGILIETHQINLSQITPGGCVAFLGISREISDTLNRTVPWQAVIVDDDSDGEIRVTPRNPIVPRSLWAAVDITSGELTVASAASAPPVQVTAPDNALPTATVITDLRRSLSLLVVRPGHGAWSGSLRDGDASDQGPADDGAIVARLADLETLWVEPGTLGSHLSALQTGDVVLGLDPDRGTYWSVVLGQ